MNDTLPLIHVTFRNSEPSQALIDAAEENVAWLEQYFDGLIACRVAFEAPHGHQRKAKSYEVSLTLEVPGAVLVARREGGRAAHADPYSALRAAFHAARRELLDYVNRTRGFVKHHSVPA